MYLKFPDLRAVAMILEFEGWDGSEEKCSKWNKSGVLACGRLISSGR
jgi:hypothetical protein